MFKVGIFYSSHVLGFTTVSLQEFNVKRHFTTAHPKHAEMSMDEKKREVSRLCASLERQSMMFVKKSTECAANISCKLRSLSDDRQAPEALFRWMANS